MRAGEIVGIAGVSGNGQRQLVEVLAGQREAELWKRATAHLNEMTRDTIDDRIDALARAAAQKVLDGASDSSVRE